VRKKEKNQNSSPVVREALQYARNPKPGEHAHAQPAGLGLKLWRAFPGAFSPVVTAHVGVKPQNLENF